MMRIQAEPGTVQLLDGDHPLGRATWVVTDAREGLIQILSLSIEAAHQRRGLGKQLLQGLYAQARFELGKNQPLRRAWIATGNKIHVVARAFLTGEGYHHVGSNSGIYRDQDLLIYVKSFD